MLPDFKHARSIRDNLTVLATIIAHARHFAATATTSASTPEFAIAAAVFGTDPLPTILQGDVTTECLPVGCS